MTSLAQQMLKKQVMVPVIALAFLLVGALALVWVEAGPAVANDEQSPPAKPKGLQVSTEAGSLAVSVDWDDVNGADDYWVRWRQKGPGQNLNEGVKPTSSSTTITVDDYGDWVVRVQACNDAGCGKPSARAFRTEQAAGPEAEPTPEPTPRPTRSNVPHKPRNLQVETWEGDLRVYVDWDKVSRATGYRVYHRAKGPDQDLIESEIYWTSSMAYVTVADYGD